MKEKKISEDVVYSLRESGVSWKKIACSLDVSVTKLSDWRLKCNFKDPAKKSSLSKEELCGIIKDVTSTNPSCGERMLLGYLKSNHIFVPRSIVRSIFASINSLRDVGGFSVLHTVGTSH
jgi:hypothetical protein